MRHQHAGLAIPDFPLAYGKLWPAMDADSVANYNARRVETTAANPITALQIGLQMAHRLLAVGILIGVGMVAWRAYRWSPRFSVPGGEEQSRAGGTGLQRLAFVWLALILVQAALGAWTIWSNKAADVATAHVMVGALSLVTGVLGCIIAFRRLAGPVEIIAPAVSSLGEERNDSFRESSATVMSQ
jgi:cytochrome c oxidase assembly protein subunit 15